MNRGENDASTKPELRASAEQLEQCYADKRDFLEMLPSTFARNSRFALFSRLPRVFLAFAFAPLKYTKNYAYSTG